MLCGFDFLMTPFEGVCSFYLVTTTFLFRMYKYTTNEKPCATDNEHTCGNRGKNEVFFDAFFRENFKQSGHGA